MSLLFCYRTWDNRMSQQETTRRINKVVDSSEEFVTGLTPRYLLLQTQLLPLLLHFIPWIVSQTWRIGSPFDLQRMTILRIYNLFTSDNLMQWLIGHSFVLAFRVNLFRVFFKTISGLCLVTSLKTSFAGLGLISVTGRKVLDLASVPDFAVLTPLLIKTRYLSQDFKNWCQRTPICKKIRQNCATFLVTNAPDWRLHDCLKTEY